MWIPFSFLLLALLVFSPARAEIRPPNDQLALQDAYLVILGASDVAALRQGFLQSDNLPCCRHDALSPLAERLTARLSELGPEPFTLALLGQIELEWQLPHQAKARFTKALALDQAQLEALTGMAQIALYEGQSRQYQKYRFLIDRHPELRWFHLAFLAKTQHQLGNEPAATQLLESALRKPYRALR